MSDNAQSDTQELKELQYQADSHTSRWWARYSIELLKEAANAPLLLPRISSAYLHSSTVLLDLR